ncbi:uncharacterized protein LOC125499747 [Athalia rosae]|uniref:uncharacterized protein LOC125499747 n=1 Tax=Athalia rosae TaxID=37344 RepID=UPI00203383C5|nr:uncharacterized protein LOC125499747 [Athalia rosae]
MAVVQAKDLAKSADQDFTKNSECHDSPYSGNCLACNVRTTNRRYKELEAQKSVVLCGPSLTSEHVSHSPEVLTKEIHKTKLRVVTTNRRVKVFGNWTEEKLFAVLTDRLLQRSVSAPPRSYEKIPPQAIKQITAGLSYNPIVHRGIYSEKILEQLRFSGEPKISI